MGRRRQLAAAVAALTGLSLTGQAAYVVQPGDTLSGIAARVGTTVADLAARNDIGDPNRIRAGDALEVPGGDAVTGGGVAASYTVRPGDALSRVAAHHGVTLAALQRANDIDDPDRIRAGQRLTIPTGAGATGPAGGGATSAAPAAPVEREAAGRILEEVARDYGWSPAFVKAVAWQESGWQMTRVSSTGAVGIMQVMPGTGDFVARRLVGRPLDLRDPRDNVAAGVAFLDYLYGLTGRDAEATLAGYYQGLASVRRNGLYDDTARYIANVLALRDRFA